MTGAPSLSNGDLPPSSPAEPLGSGPLLPTTAQNDVAAPEKERKGWWAAFKAAVKKVKRQVLTLHYANQDPRTGFLPRLVIVLALAYALSPIDVIPDFIPVLGLVDDLLILPGLILLAMWLIPAEVMEAAHQRAEHEPLRLHKAWLTAVLVFASWDALLLWGLWWAVGHWGGLAAQPYKVWIVAAAGMLLVAGEIGYLVAEHRKEARKRAALGAAGAAPELQEALLAGGSEAVQGYLDP